MTETTEDFAKELATYQAIVAEAQKELIESARAVFIKASKNLFALVPELKTVVWTQYTPYFNDGDECIFGIQGIDFTNAGPDDEELDNLGTLDVDGTDKWAIGEWRLDRDAAHYAKCGTPTMSESGRKACKAFADFVNSAEDQMKAIFGDHCKVILTEKGAQVDEYNHD